MPEFEVIKGVEYPSGFHVVSDNEFIRGITYGGYEIIVEQPFDHRIKWKVIISAMGDVIAVNDPLEG